MFLKRLIQFLFQIDSAASSIDKQQAEAALSQVSAALQAESNLSEDTKVALLTWARTIQNKLYDVPSKTDTDTDTDEKIRSRGTAAKPDYAAVLKSAVRRQNGKRSRGYHLPRGR